MAPSIQAACPLCGSLDQKIVYDLTHTNVQGGVPGLILRCCNCRMMFKQFDADLNAVYSGKHIQADTQEQYMDGERAYQFFKKVLSKSKFYGKSIQNKPKLLDIGTGLGAMLTVADELGFAPEGVELCTELADVAKAKGFKVHTGKIEELCLDTQFEIITVMDVIEHLPVPMATLRAIRKHLAPKGELIVYTPNHKAPIVQAARFLNMFGMEQPMDNIFANNHLSFFDDDTLPRALKSVDLRMREKIVRPYDIRRPGGRISLTNLLMVSAIENLGYLFTGSGFRLLIYADEVS